MGAGGSRTQSVAFAMLGCRAISAAAAPQRSHRQAGRQAAVAAELVTRRRHDDSCSAGCFCICVLSQWSTCCD
eukprot:1429701-Pleurochrysis_carterae.AAC.2